MIAGCPHSFGLEFPIVGARTRSVIGRAAIVHASIAGSRVVPAYVVVQLAPIRGARPALTRRDVKRLLSEHEAELIVSPARKTVRDAPSESATIAVPDMARANKLAAALRDMEGIEAAYAKPGEELP